MSFAASFSVEAMVRGYHVYKDIWATVVGEELPCQREDGNRADPFAVAVVRGEAVVALSTLGRLDRLSSNRHPEVANIDTMPSLLLSTSNCFVLLVLKSKF